MSTTEIGRRAEAMVADELVRRGYKIVACNWRTRWCEIDIVATKGKEVYFVEVKYRKTNAWGDGLDAITPKKLQQMSFAAEMWVSEMRWKGGYELIAASASGVPPQLDALIELS